MRGGKREGAGRRPGEQTKVVRVPAAVLDDVLALIADYRGGSSNTVTTITAPLEGVSLNTVTKITAPLEGVSLNPVTPIETPLEGLQCLDRVVRKMLIKSFGSLSKAAALGVRANGCGGLVVPEQHLGRLKVGHGLALA